MLFVQLEFPQILLDGFCPGGMDQEMNSLCYKDQVAVLVSSAVFQRNLMVTAYKSHFHRPYFTPNHGVFRKISAITR